MSHFCYLPFVSTLTLFAFSSLFPARMIQAGPKQKVLLRLLCQWPSSQFEINLCLAIIRLNRTNAIKLKKLSSFPALSRKWAKSTFARNFMPLMLVVWPMRRLGGQLNWLLTWRPRVRLLQLIISLSVNESLNMIHILELLTWEMYSVSTHTGEVL